MNIYFEPITHVFTQKEPLKNQYPYLTKLSLAEDEEEEVM